MISRQYTILIVEDSAEDRNVYCRYLSRELIFNYKRSDLTKHHKNLTYNKAVQITKRPSRVK